MGAASRSVLRIKRKRGDLQAATSNPSSRGSFMTIADTEWVPAMRPRAGRRWRYYVSRAVLKGGRQDAGSIARVRAAEIEKQVLEAVKAALASQDRSTIVLSKASSIASSAKEATDEAVRDAIERVTIGRKGPRDPIQERRHGRGPGPNIAYSVDTALALSTPRDHPNRGRAVLINPSDAGQGACCRPRSPPQGLSLAGRARDGSQSNHRIARRSRGEERTLDPYDVDGVSLRQPSSPPQSTDVCRAGSASSA